MKNEVIRINRILRILMSCLSGIILIAIFLYLSFFLSNCLIQIDKVEPVNIEVFLVFDYAYRGENQVTADNIRVYNVDVIFSEGYTKIIYSFIINNDREISVEESIEKREIPADMLLEKGILRLSTSGINYENFRKENVKVYFAPLMESFNESEYIQLDKLKKQKNCTSADCICYSLENIKNEQNIEKYFKENNNEKQFVIVLKFDSIFENKNSLLNVYKNIKSDHKILRIRLTGNITSTIYGEIQYQVNILVPNSSIFIYSDFPAKLVPYQKLGMKVLIMNIIDKNIEGVMEFYTSDNKLFIAFTALAFAICSVWLNIMIQICKGLPKDRKDKSTIKRETNDDRELNIEPNYCE